MAWRIDHIEDQPLNGELVAVGQPHRDDVGLGLLAHHRDAVSLVAQRAKAGDVVGVHMGVDRLHKLEVEFLDEAEVAVDLLQNGIDDHRLAASAAGEQVGVGAGDAVEQLAEDHGVSLMQRERVIPYITCRFFRGAAEPRNASFFSTDRSGQPIQPTGLLSPFEVRALAVTMAF